MCVCVCGKKTSMAELLAVWCGKSPIRVTRWLLEKAKRGWIVGFVGVSFFPRWLNKSSFILPKMASGIEIEVNK